MQAEGNQAVDFVQSEILASLSVLNWTSPSWWCGAGHSTSTATDTNTISNYIIIKIRDAVYPSGFVTVHPEQFIT